MSADAPRGVCATLRRLARGSARRALPGCVVETFESDATCSQGLRTQLRLHAYLEIENPVLGPVLHRFGSLVRGAFESKLTAAYRIAPGLSEMALRDHDRLLEKVRQIPNLDRDHLGQFEALVRAQPLPSTSLACLG